MEKRHYLLGAAFFATMAASFYPNHDKPVEIVEMATTHTSKTSRITDAAKPVQTVALNPREWLVEKDAPDLFYVKPKVIEAPIYANYAPKSVIMEPPQPVAPPLPFTYLGKMTEEGKITVYIAKSGRNYVLKGGEVIDGMYAVQSIDAQKIIFNYIPLKTEQVLMTRGSN
jgi:hypothetical protein